VAAGRRDSGGRLRGAAQQRGGCCGQCAHGGAAAPRLRACSSMLRALL
jgi:hypothetical protein